MKSLLPTTASLILAVLMHADARGQESDAPPEMKPLVKLLGTWKVEQTTSVPKETGSITHVVKRELVLGGRFVQEMGGFDDGEPDYTSMYTYDSQRKTYRNWFFHSSGFYWEATGTWDESDESFVFTYNPAGGGKGTISLRFTDETTFVFSMIGKDLRGEVVFQSEGKAVRQK